jgi:beta-lactamase regulating signal transducer with metallopeptidase domain
MGFFFVYILKSGVCLSLFYLFYRLLLSKETFYRFNRIALLGILVFSLLLPLIEVTKAPQNEINQAVLTIEQLLVMAENHQQTQVTAVVEGDDLVDTWRSPVHWIEIVLLFYIAGIFFLVCRNVYSLFRLVRLMNTAQRRQIDKHTVLLVHDRKVAPFSWMKFVVISRTDLEENGREILIHECAHIRKHHSWDLLIADICIFFQWFNPGAWLLKQELQNIHEYEADEAVINGGINARDYQLLLIKKAVGTRLYSMANSFNHSKLKNVSL